jgi:hypothetical protein
MEAAESQSGRVTTMQRMWRHMFAALAGVLAVVGAASAQTPGHYSIPQQQPSGVSRLNAVVSPAPIALAGGQTYIRGSGGCNGCGTPAPCATPCASPCPTARDCNNGCGSAKSDCRFMFGSCKSFFDPCGPSGNGHGRHGGRCGGGLGGHHDRCGTWTFGAGYNTGGCNMCLYSSFLLH